MEKRCDTSRQNSLFFHSLEPCFAPVIKAGSVTPKLHVTVAHDTFEQDGILDFPDFFGALKQNSVDLFVDPEPFPAELAHLSHKVQPFESIVLIKGFPNLGDRFDLHKLTGL